MKNAMRLPPETTGGDDVLDQLEPAHRLVEHLRTPAALTSGSLGWHRCLERQPAMALS